MNCPNINQFQKVSSDAEDLILVNEQDEPTGFLSKGEVHNGQGILHRAFSVFIFNAEGELLLQKRSNAKKLWPGYWSNSCCSHPRKGEDMLEAANRRIYQELGISSELNYVYKFIYHAPYEDIGSEHEYCWVYIGSVTEEINVNVNEIAEYRFIKVIQLNQEVKSHPHRFTPWMHLEWQYLTTKFKNNFPPFQIGFNHT